MQTAFVDLDVLKPGSLTQTSISGQRASEGVFGSISELCQAEGSELLAESEETMAEIPYLFMFILSVTDLLYV